MDISQIMDYYASEATCQFGNNLGIVGRANIEKVRNIGFNPLLDILRLAKHDSSSSNSSRFYTA